MTIIITFCFASKFNLDNKLLLFASLTHCTIPSPNERHSNINCALLTHWMDTIIAFTNNIFATGCLWDLLCSQQPFVATSKRMGLRKPQKNPAKKLPPNTHETMPSSYCGSEEPQLDESIIRANTSNEYCFEGQVSPVSKNLQWRKQHHSNWLWPGSNWSTDSRRAGWLAGSCRRWGRRRRERRAFSLVQLLPRYTGSLVVVFSMAEQRLILYFVGEHAGAQ